MAQSKAASSLAADTFPKLLLEHARVRPDGVAIREKDLGIWQSWSWSQVADEVRALACGLAAQGFRRGMNLAIIGDNRPRLYWSFAAAQSLGGVPVPLYQDSVAQEMLYVLENAEIEYAIVEDQEQVDKLLEILPQYPRLKHIYYDDPRGLRNYRQPQLLAYDRLREIGLEHHRQLPDFFHNAVEQVLPRERLRDALHLGDHRQTQRRVPYPRRIHRRGARRREVRRVLARRRSAFLPADGLGRRPSVLLRTGDGGGLHRQLPGILRNRDERSARDRPHVLLRAAAGFREPADHGHDPHRRRQPPQTPAIPRLHESSSALWRGDHGRQAGGADRPSALRTRRSADLRAAAQRAGHEPHPRGLHRWRCNRPRPVPLLPLHRHQSKTALRPDRNQRLRLQAAHRRRQARFGRPAAARSGDQDRRERRSHGEDARHAQGVLQAPGRDRGIHLSRRILHDRATRASSMPTAT